MASQSQQNLHILLFPLMAPGHMLPMLDIAALLAARGVASTVLTTPANAPLVQPSVDRSPLIKLRLVPFPTCSGLPQGCENLSQLPSQSLQPAFYAAVGKLRQVFDLVLTELLPDCVVADGFLPWTHHAASELGIPRLVFHGTGLFASCVMDVVFRLEPHKNPDSPSFVVPGLPHRIEMLTSQIPASRSAVFAEIIAWMVETEPKSYGVVVNTFYELEPDYVRHYRHVVGRRAWCVGPVSLSRSRDVGRETCLNWLDGQTPGAVVYVSFGSLCELSEDQFREIALGMEGSGSPFVWVIGDDRDGWLPAGYEQRVGDSGLIVRGWAPQTMILGHAAVGGFMTHCGWNSSLEGVCAGLPLLTWPYFADQFFNEKLIVDVLNIGVAIGVEKCGIMPEEKPLIGAEVIKRAVSRLMDGGGEAAGMRRRAREEGERARRLEAEVAARMESECKEWQHWLGAECLVEHLKEEQASREAAVDKWKHLYLTIKHELDALLLRSHPGGGFDLEVVGRLQAEAMEKDEMIEGLQARLSLMEKERVKKEREVDILRQSLRILNTCKRSGMRRSLHRRWL